jgi:hypothetical protein
VGKPDKPADYVAIQVGEWARRYGTIYVPREMWESLRPGAQEFLFYIQHHGRCRLEFDAPIGRLEV